jgi:hypothetical protein
VRPYILAGAHEPKTLFASGQRFGAPVILEKIKITFVCFKKIRKYYVVANELSHKRAKF